MPLSSWRPPRCLTRYNKALPLALKHLKPQTEDGSARRQRRRRHGCELPKKKPGKPRGGRRHPTSSQPRKGSDHKSDAAGTWPRPAGEPCGKHPQGVALSSYPHRDGRLPGLRQTKPSAVRIALRGPKPTERFVIDSHTHCALGDLIRKNIALAQPEGRDGESHPHSADASSWRRRQHCASLPVEGERPRARPPSPP